MIIDKTLEQRSLSKYCSNNKQSIFGITKKTLSDLKQKDIKTYVVATQDDYIIMGGHIYKYVGEFSYKDNNDLLI